jgi:hypothetical protein
MTTERILADHKDKRSDCNQSYSNCHVCAFNGFADEKVVFKFEGLRAEHEDGFIFKFTVYNYPNQGRIHHHKPLRVLEVNSSVCRHCTDSLHVISRRIQKSKESD